MSREFIKEVNKKEFKARKNSYVTKTYYKCLYCGVEYDTEEKAEICLDKHELVFLPIATNDLARLNRFFLTKDEKLLTPELVRIVRRYVQQRIRSR